MTLSSCVCKVPWALRGGCAGNAVSAETSAAFSAYTLYRKPPKPARPVVSSRLPFAQKHRPQAGRKPDISPCLVRLGRGRRLRCGVYAGNAINAVNSRRRIRFVSVPILSATVATIATMFLTVSFSPSRPSLSSRFGLFDHFILDLIDQHSGR